MDLRSYFAKDTLANIAKGRYNREKVEDMFGFGAKRLSRFVEAMQPQITAFDAGAYDMDDMRQALVDDARAKLDEKAKFGLDFIWGGKDGEKTESEPE